MADENAPVVSENAKRFKPLKGRLLMELKVNALDFENPPTEPAKEAPHPMQFVSEFDGTGEQNPKGQNSIALLDQIKKWELELPSMSLIVHSGATHPLYLITDKGLRDQRADFLKSRPRFNDNYFDGQRDPVEGWMAATNAWRLPALYVGPNYSMPDFWYRPPPTLFIDAALQAQDDAELIASNDSPVNDEWIMDAVTHQPFAKHAAMKGADGVFCWDLNRRPEITPGEVKPTQTEYVGNMRQSYDDWWAGMQEQWTTLAENNSTMQLILMARSNSLVGTTRPKSIMNWNRITNLIRLQDIQKQEKAKESELDQGEVRLEIMWAQFNKIGVAKMGGVSQANATGDGLMVVRSVIPGDNPPLQVSEPYPVKRGCSKFKGRSHDRIERRYQTEHNAAERAELNEILEDHDPSRSEIVIEVALANKQGREILGGKGILGSVRVSLKELLRDGKANAAGTCETIGELELTGPAPEEDDDDDEEEEEEEDAPAVPMVVIGTMCARIAIRPPEPPLQEASHADEDATPGPASATPTHSLTAGPPAKLNLKDSLVYTVAYWIKWKLSVETLSEQLLMFGEARNMPALVRDGKLGALVDNIFCATAFDLRVAGDKWYLLVVTNDGTYSRFWIGYSTSDVSGEPQPCEALEPEPERGASDVRTVMGAGVGLKRLVTTANGAGLLAQAWVWPRDLEPTEIHELWARTKGRYWRGGIGEPTKTAPIDAAAQCGKDGTGGVDEDPLPWDIQDQFLAKDIERMLEVPLASKLAYQRLVSVFSVLVGYVMSSDEFLVIDRVNNMSPTAELLIEVALRTNGCTPPVGLVMDSRERLEAANRMLNDLIECGFLIDEEKAFKSSSGLKEPRLTEYKLTSTNYAGPKADLRRLVTPAGLAWLRSSAADLNKTVELIDNLGRHPSMCKRVQEIFREHGCGHDLLKDGRPKLGRIWKVFYQAQLFASVTHYIVFDEVEPLAKPIIHTLGEVGAIFMSGSTMEHAKIRDTLQGGSPILLLESMGGVTQAFAHAMKIVRMMQPRWDIDFVLGLVAEYKERAARMMHPHETKAINRRYMLENIHLLDKELARIDLLCATDSEGWMKDFGLPEVLILFEVWQRSPEFLMKQVQMADVMKTNAEQLLDTFTGCFSGDILLPEHGLGNAETKVVATAWNRHLLLYNHAMAYRFRSSVMYYVLCILGLATTTLSTLLGNPDMGRAGESTIGALMLCATLFSALLGTVATRLRTDQKYSIFTTAAHEIVCDIYKFRVRAMEYDKEAIAAAICDENKSNAESDAPIPPISNNELVKFARHLFVERVQAIYQDAMGSELLKGASIPHKTSGMDPQRMLRDEERDAARVSKELLMHHLAGRVYNISVCEWALGTAHVSAERERLGRFAVTTAIITTTIAFVCNLIENLMSRFGQGPAAEIGDLSGVWFSVEKATGHPNGDRFELRRDGDRYMYFIVRPPGGGTDEGDFFTFDATTAHHVHGPTATLLPSGDLHWDYEGGKWLSRRGEGPPAESREPGDEGQPRMHTLDETWCDECGGGGSGDQIKDNMFSTLTIDEYMSYHAMAVNAHVERTPPPRGQPVSIAAHAKPPFRRCSFTSSRSLCSPSPRAVASSSVCVARRVGRALCPTSPSLSPPWRCSTRSSRSRALRNRSSRTKRPSATSARCSSNGTA